MPPHAHSISAGRPAAPDTAPFPVLHGLLELAKGIAIRCFCLGDFSPHDSGLRSGAARAAMRSEEHTSELQSRRDLVCRLLLEKKKNKTKRINTQFFVKKYVF